MGLIALPEIRPMSQDHWFACPHCAMRYAWQPQHAGRKVRCRCTAMMRIPTEPDQTAALLEPVQTASSSKSAASSDKQLSAGSYVVQLESHDTSMAPAPCPKCGRILRAGALVCTGCGTKLRTTENEAPEVFSDGTSLVAQLVAEAEPVVDKVVRSENVVKSQLEKIESRFAYDRQVEAEVTTQALIIDVVLPLVLTLAGLALLAVELKFYEPRMFALMAHPLLARAMLHGLNILMGFIFFALGVLFVAKLFGNAPGTLGKLLLKLTAISVFCVATDATFHWGLDIITEGYAVLGGYLKLIVSGVVFFTVAGILLGLDILELLVLFTFSRMVPMMMMMFTAAIIYSLFE